MRNHRSRMQASDETCACEASGRVRRTSDAMKYLEWLSDNWVPCFGVLCMGMVFVLVLAVW